MRVTRTAKGLAHHNTLDLRKVKIYFQKFPGKHGTDAVRGIKDVEFTLKVGGRVVDKGKTAADGSVTVHLPAGERALLHIFSTDYELHLLPRIEPETAAKGQQQRLTFLGYDPGTPDGTLRKETDLAALQFQANTGLDPKGSLGNTGIDATTYNKIKSEFGE